MVTKDPNGTPSLPANPPPSGTVDITDLVANIKDTWVRLNVNLIMGAVTGSVWTSWLAWPVVNVFTKLFLNLILTRVANGVEMMAFFANTAIRKASQAADYVNAKDVLDSLPTSATKEDFKNAELAEMAAFRNFVMVTN